MLPRATNRSLLKGESQSCLCKKNRPQAPEEYTQQEQILNGRNFYSMTDPDAMFTRMKEDHVKTGQFEPGYNVRFPPPINMWRIIPFVRIRPTP